MSTRQTTDGTRLDSARIGPDDPRYVAVVEKRFNKRFRASPDYVRLVSSTDEVAAAVEEAVREARRLVVTSGGHCLEGFVADPDVRVTRTDHDVTGGMFGLATYGGRINTVARDATASAQRDAILDIACTTGWLDPREEAKNLTWARAFYRDLFSETGGVPVPGEAFGGALVNHPDVDLADLALNTSGVPWHTLYYGENYPRLQRIKAKWDPRNVFRHALSIRPG